LELSPVILFHGPFQQDCHGLIFLVMMSVGAPTVPWSRLRNAHVVMAPGGCGLHVPVEVRCPSRDIPAWRGPAPTGVRRPV